MNWRHILEEIITVWHRHDKNQTTNISPSFLVLYFWVKMVVYLMIMTLTKMINSFIFVVFYAPEKVWYLFKMHHQRLEIDKEVLYIYSISKRYKIAVNGLNLLSYSDRHGSYGQCCIFFYFPLMQYKCIFMHMFF